MENKLKQTWDLEIFFPGGSDSTEFADYLAELEQSIAQLNINSEKFELDKLIEIISKLQNLMDKLMEAAAFIGCLLAQNVQDKQAKVLLGRLLQLDADLNKAEITLDNIFVSLSEEDWNQLVHSKEITPIAFSLVERRKKFAEKLSMEQEILVNDLAVDGYHAWEELYDTIVGQITIEQAVKEEKINLSVGQATNLLSNSSRAVRAEIFAKLQQAWSSQGDLCATALNHLSGFRINLYKNRNWNSVLKEPLTNNRLSEESLMAMWAVVEQSKEKLAEYLNAKAKYLKIASLNWHDLQAPLGKIDKKIPYDDAAAFIVEKFAGFSSELSEFAKMAFNNGWIEAENRPNKEPGGFCTTFRESKQSRIFMTYSGTAQGVSTLAHELGHAYHAYLTRDLPALTADYPMSLAETASTFTELIISDGAIRKVDDSQEKLVLLDERLQEAVALFMNIRARFLFEFEFYEKRKQKLLTVEDLNELMVKCQKQAYNNALSSYEPYLWAAKGHFYITGEPFYNFPYTVGYLFSCGIYARARKEGEQFAQKYRSLLRDTGKMTVEDLAIKHLGIDLTQKSFWQTAANLVLKDVDVFQRLVDATC